MPSRSKAGDEAPLILVVEDNPPDVLLIEEAISEHGLNARLQNVRDGEQAIRIIRRLDADEALPCPALVLLDLNIPARNGEEVLAEIRKSRRCARTPVVIVTSSDSPLDRQNTKRLGADYYFCKPTDLDAFLKLGEVVRKMLGR